MFKIYCGVEQLVARWAHNPKVVRSSRAPATTKPWRFFFEAFFYYLNIYDLRTILSQFQEFYIGFSSNFEKRLLSHNKLATKGYTIKYRPWEVLFTENFKSKSEALIREKQLKQAKSRKEIWWLISERYS